MGLDGRGGRDLVFTGSGQAKVFESLRNRTDDFLKHRSLSLTLRTCMYVYMHPHAEMAFNMHIARARNGVSSSRLQDAIGH